MDVSFKKPMIKIRPALTNDAKKIAYIKNTTWKDTYKNLIDSFYLDNLEISQEIINKWKNRILDTKSNQTYFWVALKSNQVVGFLWGGGARDPKIEKLKYELYAFYVLPKYQHQGIGKKLFSTFANNIKKDFFLWMLKDNMSELIYEKLKCQKTNYENLIDIGNKQYKEIAFIYKHKNIN